MNGLVWWWSGAVWRGECEHLPAARSQPTELSMEHAEEARCGNFEWCSGVDEGGGWLHGGEVNRAARFRTVRSAPLDWRAGGSQADRPCGRRCERTRPSGAAGLVVVVRGGGLHSTSLHKI